MPQYPNSAIEQEILKMEKLLLQAVCQSATEPKLREEVLSRLRAYPFRVVHHQVLFDCLRKMPGHRPELIPSLLPARLVQAGFPDLDADPFLEPCPMTKAEASALLERLMPHRQPRSLKETSAGATRWILLPAVIVVILAATAAFAQVAHWRSEAQFSQLATEHYLFFYRAEDYNQAEIETFAQQRESAYPAMAARLGVEPPQEKIRFFLYSSYEQKAAQDHGRSEFFADPEQLTVAALWNETTPQVEPLADALVLAGQTWGEPAHPFLELAAAAYAAGSWRGQPLARWGGQITSEEGPYTLELLANADSGTGSEGEFLSPLVRRPLAGELARWVVSRWGLETLRKLYSTAKAPLIQNMASVLGLTAAEMESEWRQWLAKQAGSYTPPPRAVLPPPFFQRGVAFTQERWRDGGDYASPRMSEVLAVLKPLGVDSITVSPFAFMTGPDIPDLTRFSGESDEGIQNITFLAHRAGLRVMLKPQVWLRGGMFAGSVHFTNARDRQRWFSEYRQWILHNARLAELNGSDLLCIGNELRQMTRYAPQWRELIATVRRVYHGPITYAANWGEEFETLPFWDAVDYIGLNNYYPLAKGGKGNDTSAAALQQGAEALAQRVGQVARRWKKPVIFTEVGFPSVQGGATQPWNERISKVVDTGEQARAYEATFRAFYDKPWFYGMYWWKWYSTGSGGGVNDGMLTPMNKPAAEVLARWYRRPDPRHRGPQKSG